MRLSGILALYIARHYLKWLAVVFFGLAALIFLVDAVELLRRAGSRDGVSFGLVLRMAALKLPYMLELILPFAVLFGGMLAFWRLTRTWELVVVRTVGVSAWRFLLPALVIAFMIGAAKAALYSPLASVAQARFESLQAEHFNTQRHVFSISRDGFRLRDVHGGSQSMLFADGLDPKDRTLHGVVLYRFHGQEEFRDRLDAATAELRPGYWLLQGVRRTGPDAVTHPSETVKVATDLDWRRIEDSFSPPETMSFWQLPGYIGVLEKAGFPALRHRVHFHAMTAAPVLFAAMALIAGVFALRPARRGGVAWMLAAGVAAGFVLFLLSDTVTALGAAGRVPVVLAAWMPAGLAALAGLTMLLHLEDG